jgi:hypothetical protein
MVGRNMSLKNPVTQPGIDPGTVRLVAQHLNHYATSGPHNTKAYRQKSPANFKFHAIILTTLATYCNFTLSLLSCWNIPSQDLKVFPQDYKTNACWRNSMPLNPISITADWTRHRLSLSRNSSEIARRTCRTSSEAAEFCTSHIL